ncbi:MAG: radical SAM family heme chaperone HemW [Limnochordales bacterium]|nr:radical SAM family heme chaperone HemW [Limnochordales bacterium]
MGWQAEAGIYVHIPFCRRKCFYCDFPVLAARREATVSRYVDALIREIELWGEQMQAGWLASGRSGEAGQFVSLYLGGGTPTYLNSSQLLRLLAVLRQHFPLTPDAEITLEANPDRESLTEEKLAALRAAGVNRLSLGAQVFDDGYLRAIGRDHNVRDIESAFILARRAGFTNINLDLIFALPGQSIEEWQLTLERALALQPEHLSCYSLIFEEGTLFERWRAQGRVDPVPEETELKMYELACNLVSAAGLRQYEISNFARPGRESRHNLLYWRYQNWLGLGAGAHSHWGDRRWANLWPPGRYEDRLQEAILPIDTGTELSLSIEEMMEEMVIMGLRLIEGVSGQEFARRFGRSLDEVYGDTITRLVGAGFLARTPEGRIRLTRRGLPVGNAIFAEFLLTPGSLTT